MTRIASYVAGFVLIAGLLCLPALFGGDGAAADRPDLPWSPRWDDVLGTNVALLLLVLVVGLAGALFGGHHGATTGERAPSYVPTQAPPEGLGPAQAVHVLGERLTNRTFVGSLLHAAERGAVSVRREDRDWVVTELPEAAAGVDVVTQASYRPLLDGNGSFRLAPDSAETGDRLGRALAGLREEARAWGVASGTMSRTGLAGRCVGVLALGVLLVAVCLLARPFGMSMLGVLPGALVVCGVSMAFSGVGSRHTRRGRDLWARVGGFRRMLQSPSSRLRFGFARREDLYTAYVPWAVTFGCEREWAQKYRTEVGAEPPFPGFLGSYAGEHTVDHVAALVHSLDATVAAAITAHRVAGRRRERTPLRRR